MKRMTSRLTRVLVITLLCGAAVTTVSSQESPKADVNALAAKGEAIANQDPLAVELRTQQPEGPRRRGFDIGMAAAEGHTLPGPGKDRICASLPPAEQGGCSVAVLFSVDRNRNAKLAETGAKIAQANPAVAAGRNANTDVFYRLGFDIATGIFGDPALGAKGNTETGPGSLGIRDALSPRGQRGFNASVYLHLGRTDERTPESRTRSSAEDSRGGALEKKRDPGGTSAAFQPENTIKVSVRYKKEFGYVGDTDAFGYVGPTSCGAFSISALPDPSVRLEYLIGIQNPTKMRESDGFYVCDFLVKDLPLNAPIKVGVDLADHRSAPFEAWKGGSAAQPPPGQQRTIIIVSGRDSGTTGVDAGDFAARSRVQDRSSTVTLTKTQPRATQVFEMVYAGAALAPEPIRAQGRVRLPAGTTPSPSRPICESARLARERNSPAAPGLEQKCLAAKGEAIANADPVVAAARNAEPDGFYRMGFDIATAIFGDPALGAQGNTATGPGSLGIRDSLNAAGQRGFNASLALHLSRNYK